MILDKGKIICQDTPAKLKSQYTSNRLVWYTEQSEEAENILAELGDGKLTYEADHYRGYGNDEPWYEHLEYFLQIVLVGLQAFHQIEYEHEEHWKTADR